MNPAPDSDRILLAHMRECIERVGDYTPGEKGRFLASRMIQDAVVRNLQTRTGSSQRLSNGPRVSRKFGAIQK